MKSPLEIMHEIERLKELANSISSPTNEILKRSIENKIEAFEWVLSEKP